MAQQAMMRLNAIFLSVVLVLAKLDILCWLSLDCSFGSVWTGFPPPSLRAPPPPFILAWAGPMVFWSLSPPPLPVAIPSGSGLGGGGVSPPPLGVAWSLFLDHQG